MPQIITEGNISYTIPTQDEIDASIAAQNLIDAENALKAQKALIQSQLDAIDLKSIRAIREGDTTRMAQWEAQAATLRTQLASL